MANYYSQAAVIGIAVPLESIKRVIKPAVYQWKDRFCPNTGNWLKVEKVKTEDEISEYEFDGKKYQYNSEIIEDTSIRPFCAFITRNENKETVLIVGRVLGISTDLGRSDLLRGSLLFDELIQKRDSVKERFPDHDVNLHFFIVEG